MKILARAYCWWNPFDKDIEDLVSNCTTCQSNRPDPTAVPVHCWLLPNKVFERVHADYAGPFMGKYLFVLVDALSKWPEVHIVNNMTAETTVRLCGEIFSRFGLPRVFVSDYGTQFTSREFKQFLKNNGIVHKQGAPYHPATHGQAERFVQTVKNKLKAKGCQQKSLHHILSTILMAYRRAMHPATKESPAMMMFGRQIQSRLDLMLPLTTTENTEYVRTIKSFAVGERVAVRDYLASDKRRFGKVVEPQANCTITWC
ncbi:PREDICTED: uncharacterized protein K02A2.6-like [Rhagoletis zephyria]|uniref:uncharacterized protein K02A2.6-like n=1 Tax=Rhagoletis zephyria TaxID=28612 RepID=UPI00081156A4|nr:PREDICTED: uncharacterized protein K02A2.6-like [Rhagoletis zephyria]